MLNTKYIRCRDLKKSDFDYFIKLVEQTMEESGKCSVSFLTDDSGDIYGAVITYDDKDRDKKYKYHVTVAFRERISDDYCGFYGSYQEDDYKYIERVTGLIRAKSEGKVFVEWHDDFACITTRTKIKGGDK